MISQILREKVLDLDIAIVCDLQIQVPVPLMFTDEHIISYMHTKLYSMLWLCRVCQTFSVTS